MRGVAELMHFSLIRCVACFINFIQLLWFFPRAVMRNYLSFGDPLDITWPSFFWIYFRGHTKALHDKTHKKTRTFRESDWLQKPKPWKLLQPLPKKNRLSVGKIRPNPWINEQPLWQPASSEKKSAQPYFCIFAKNFWNGCDCLTWRFPFDYLDCIS